ncbi:MAG: thioredoxin-disulfide reductase [Propionibacteriaceae bacterium]|jgi:thioredoxin reductase (NADPH)|nr:thioredoxin-disulfide reductase [Propionibacteriaceae bacterium]
MTDVRDLVIVGSGPAGLTAAIYAARAGLAPLVIEGALTAGGALMTTTEVENFPGFPDGIQGPDLMAQMRQQALRFEAEFVTDDVTAVDLTGPIKVITDAEGNQYQARSVILATGSAYRKLGLTDEARLSGRGVSWCATCDGFFYRNKNVAVIGGGDSALEEATFLTRFAESVTVIHRRDQLRASKIMIDRAMANPSIQFRWNSVVTAIQGDQQATSLVLRDKQTGETSELPIDGVFIAIGHEPRNELFRDQIELDAAGYVVVAAPGQATNVAGVFACGDVVDSTYRQAITAAASGCRAAIDAQEYLVSLGGDGLVAWR